MRTPFFVLATALAVATSANAAAFICTSDTDCPSPACGTGVCSRGGFCTVVAGRKGAECRPSAGPCDPAEFCDGVSPVCPPNVLAPATKMCRGASGAACDAPDFCDGSHPDCPDTFAPTTTICRPSAGACDVPESCTGTGPDCPPDQAANSGTICRPSEGACDAAEQCDGTHVTCPDDAVLAAGTVCRAAANDCDVQETCTGNSKSCPGDSYASPGTACDSASACFSGGACAGPICIGGTPELTFTPDSAEFTQSVHEIDVSIKHTGAGAPISLSGASIQPSGTFSIVAAPHWPVSLQSGAEAHLTVRLADDAAPGDHVATLTLQAANCADQPLQLHAVVASPADAGAGPAAPSSSGGSSGDAPKAGGCSSGAAPTGTLALVALAGLAVRRRSRQRRARA